jgi:hypothetical protein
MKKLQIAICAASLAVALNASADVTYSGTALQGLTYVGNTGDAQYVAGTPDVAQLYTANSGTANADDSPAVFVQGPMGTLSDFSSSYDLYSSSGGNGNSPYWNLQVSMGGTIVNIIAMGGSTLDGSSDIHAYNSDYSAAIGTWGMTLSALDALTYNGDTIGDMTVDWAGVEIGDWNNGDATVPASAEFDSITVPAPVPEPTTIISGALLLLPFGAGVARKLCKKHTA